MHTSSVRCPLMVHLTILMLLKFTGYESCYYRHGNIVVRSSCTIVTCATVQVQTIPHQDNYHDCGLYTLTYMEFFCYHTPLQIHCLKLNSRIQLHMYFGETGRETGRDVEFLKAGWFSQRNGSNLRFHLMVELLENMINKAKQEGRSETMQSTLSTAAAIKLDYEQRFQDDSGLPNHNMCVHWNRLQSWQFSFGFDADLHVMTDSIQYDYLPAPSLT